MYQIGLHVKYKGEWENCHAQKYRIASKYLALSGCYYDLEAIDWNILSGSYAEILSAREEDIELFLEEREGE